MHIQTTSPKNNPNIMRIMRIQAINLTITYINVTVAGMSTVQPPLSFRLLHKVECEPPVVEKFGYVRLFGINAVGLYGHSARVKSMLLKPIKAKENHGASLIHDSSPTYQGLSSHKEPHSTSFSGKSTLECDLSRSLHSRGKLTYILDGDNIWQGLNCDLSFSTEDCSENIRRIGVVAKLLADAGVICISSSISPYRKDRHAYRALLPREDSIEVFLDIPLDICEARDPKGLYKLAPAGKVKGFTGIDNPYEPPCCREIVLQQKGSDSMSPGDAAEILISFLEKNGYLWAWLFLSQVFLNRRL